MIRKHHDRDENREEAGQEPFPGRKTELAGAILAGGKSLRMGGREKSLLRVGGVPLIRRTIDLLKNFFKEIILVTNEPEEFRRYAGEVVLTPDIVRDVGPLGGIHAGLYRTSKEAVFVVACDMPFLDFALIQKEIEAFKAIDVEALVPRMRAGGRSFIEPLHAVYKRSLSDALRRFLQESRNYAVRDFLAVIDVHYLELEDNRLNRRRFVNINTHQDLKQVVPDHHNGRPVGLE